MATHQLTRWQFVQFCHRTFVMYRITEQFMLQGTHGDHLAQSLLLTSLTKTKSAIQMSLALL